jgi:adenine-specific DNA-methyltransferase
MEQMIKEGRIYFGSGNRVPRLKRFLSESMPGLVPNTWWSGEDVGTADTAKRHLKSMFPHLIPFETPKPEGLAARIIEISTCPGDRVVDIYGGSGTTAAVSHKLGRRWITCEREQRTFNEFTKPRLDLVVSGKDVGGIVYDPASEPREGYTVVDGYAGKAEPVG